MKRFALFAALLVVLTGCAPTPVDPRVIQQQDVAWEVFLDTYPDANVERPEVEVVKIVSFEQRPFEIGICMRDAGFEATRSGDGSWEFSGGDPQDLGLALYVCKVQYPDEFDFRPESHSPR